jgi:PAS domain S-box-containing protein
MGEALLVLSPEGKITQVNPALRQMLGYSDAELLGMGIGDIFEEQEEEQAGAFMGTWLEALIRVGALREIDARFITRDGRRLPIVFSRTAVTDAAGEIINILCIAKDMTGYIRHEADNPATSCQQ